MSKAKKWYSHRMMGRALKPSYRVSSGMLALEMKASGEICYVGWTDSFVVCPRCLGFKKDFAKLTANIEPHRLSLTACSKEDSFKIHEHMQKQFPIHKMEDSSLIKVSILGKLGGD